MMFFKVLLATSFLASTSLLFGQASEDEMRRFPMSPPASPILMTKHLAYVGDYGYYRYPARAEFGHDGSSAQVYKYVRYTGVAGKKVYIYPTWHSAIPAATSTSDACGHTHLSFGVWARYRLPAPLSVSRWIFVGGGGMSGVREGGRCRHRAQNSLSAFDSRFGWGEDFLSLDFRNNQLVQEIIVGALGNTHGWGTCTAPAGQFPACREPVNINVWTLPN